MDTTNGVSKYAVGGVFAVECGDFIFDLRWGVGLLITLILADLWFGLSESRRKGIATPKSKCIRRTLNKICDYSAVMMVFLFLGGLMFNQPVAGLFVGIVLSCAAEGISVSGHVFFLRGIKFSWRKFLIALIKFRCKELGSAFEKATEENVEQVREKIKEEDHYGRL